MSFLLNSHLPQEDAPYAPAPRSGFAVHPAPMPTSSDHGTITPLSPQGPTAMHPVGGPTTPFGTQSQRANGTSIGPWDPYDPYGTGSQGADTAPPPYDQPY